MGNRAISNRISNAVLSCTFPDISRIKEKALNKSLESVEIQGFFLFLLVEISGIEPLTS